MRNYPLHEYLIYTRSERNAAVVLIILSAFFFILPQFYPLFLGPKTVIDFSEYREAIASLHFQHEASTEKETGFAKRGEFEHRVAESFAFDPNVASTEDFVRLGLSERTAKTILNYRNKGGKFYKKEDFGKIYGLRKEDYARLQPWIRIEGKSARDFDRPGGYEKKEGYSRQPEEFTAKDGTSYSKTWVPKEKTPVIIDINTASAEDWMLLKGIGQGYARRIVNFREKLGGFSSIQQIGETFGLPDSTFQEIVSSLQPSAIFRPVKINTATVEELKSHPYFSNFQAVSLINYRQQHGAFTNMEALKKVATLKETDLARLTPYISFD